MECHYRLVLHLLVETVEERHTAFSFISDSRCWADHRSQRLTTYVLGQTRPTVGHRVIQPTYAEEDRRTSQ